ncbi:MAG: ATP-binding cassette domain-containing protein [Candidatus ainarchaeum sp.]|nr:ATP-binding cassette domain-containing protein [Candidatus ainarchaeum sp.]
MIKLENFSLAFKAKKIIQGLNLQIGSNEKIAIIGANGTGKTSLAFFLAGVIPDFVPAQISGKYKLPAKASLIMQNPSNQFFAISAKEELGEKGVLLAKKLNAGHLLERNIFQFSEGEKQKLNLIANLALKPEALLLDEPLELLDPVESGRFRKMLEKAGRGAIVWFDKKDNFVSAEKKFFLQKPKKVFLPEKKKNTLKEIVLEADFKISAPTVLSAGFSLHKGEKIAIIGRNGSGKTTLLKTIARLNKFSGKLLLKEKVSFAPQNPSHLFFNETVEEELFDKANAHLLGISHLLKSSPDRLSRGQQKLVSIAAVKAGTIALLDEPTTWLDSENKAVVYGFISNSSDSMIISTHDKKLLDYCDRVFIIEKGVLEECSNTKANRFFQGLQNY